MDPIRLARPRSRRTLGAPGPPTPTAAHRCYPKPLLYPLSDRGTKWLGQGKAFDYAQQNVNPHRVSRPPQALRQPDPWQGCRAWARGPNGQNAPISRVLRPTPRDFRAFGVSLIASAKPVSTFTARNPRRFKGRRPSCPAAWNLNLRALARPPRGFSSCSAKKGSSSVRSRAKPWDLRKSW